MAQIPKGGLVKGPYKPICRDCAITTVSWPPFLPSCCSYLFPLFSQAVIRFRRPVTKRLLLIREPRSILEIFNTWSCFFKEPGQEVGWLFYWKKAQTRFVISAVSLGAGFCPSMITMHIEAFVPQLNSTVFTRRPSFLEYRTCNLCNLPVSTGSLKF